jgi:hypothetical protein
MLASPARTFTAIALAVSVGLAPLVACKKKETAAPADAAVDAAPLVLEVPDAGPPDTGIDAAPAVHVHTGPPVIPGACVDPSADAKSHGTGTGPTVASEPDLDGDGKPDKILTFGGPDVSHPFVAYVMRGSCGHFVGALKAGTLAAAKSKSHGLADLQGHIPCKAKCNCTTQDFTAHFNGSSYLEGPVTETLLTCARGQKP